MDRSRLQFKKKIALAASSSSNENAEKGAMVTRYNFILVVGADEVDHGTADVRTPGSTKSKKMAVADIISMFRLLSESHSGIEADLQHLL